MYTPSNNKSKAAHATTAKLRAELSSLEAEKGPDDSATIAALNKFAEHLLDIYEDEEAESFQRRVCAYREQTLGAEHPDTLASLARLADLFCDLDRYDDAAPLYLKVLELRSKVLGPEHPDTLQCLVEYAELLEFQEDFSTAETLYIRAIESAEKVFGPDGKKTNEYKTSLKICRQNMGKEKQDSVETEETGDAKKGCGSKAAIVFVAFCLAAHYWIG